MLLLLFKLTSVAFLLWAALAVLGVSAEGVMIGIGVALGALVYGANRGSTSPEGQRAMADAEAKIREELGDKDTESS